MRYTAIWFLKTLRNISIAIGLHIIISTIAFDIQNKDVCINSDLFFRSAYLSEIRQVIKEYRRQGVNLKLNCSSNSILLETGMLEDSILAQALPYGVILPIHSTPGIEKEIFIPIYHFRVRKIVFNGNHFKNSSTEPPLMFQSVLVHEIGHILGAPHIHTNHSHIMSPYLDNDKNDLARSVKEVLKLTNKFSWKNYLP